MVNNSMNGKACSIVQISAVQCAIAFHTNMPAMSWS